MVRCLGILREIENSPRREDDDALILRAALAELERQHVTIEVVSATAFDRLDLNEWDLILPMCESYTRLLRLRKVARAGTLVINDPEAVLSCYRTRMLEKLSDAPGLSFPETEVRSVSASGGVQPPAFAAPQGFWIKRGDVHNTVQGRDVIYVGDLAEAARVREEFARREIPSFLLQRHIDGDLIKFYGVGPGQWFTWFYHDPENARHLHFELEGLALQAEKAAVALGLDIFGGDAIVAPEGTIHVIDLNSWPSFARVRGEAAVQIARRVLARVKRSRASRRTS